MGGVENKTKKQNSNLVAAALISLSGEASELVGVCAAGGDAGSVAGELAAEDKAHPEGGSPRAELPLAVLAGAGGDFGWPLTAARIR